MRGLFNDPHCLRVRLYARAFDALKTTFHTISLASPLTTSIRHETLQHSSLHYLSYLWIHFVLRINSSSFSIWLKHPSHFRLNTR